MLLDYAARQEWEVVGIYSDDDYTGADRRRPAFQQLLSDARRRRFDIVLCKTLSRFTREMELVETYLHGLFPAWGIRFVSVVDNADTADHANKKSRQINGLINEWYLEDMSENIRSVLDSRRRSGLHIGAFALYGYRKDPEHKGHLLIDEQAAVVVREIFLLYAAGHGKGTIARLLNERGLPNPTHYKQLQGLRYQAGRSCSPFWRAETIRRILCNEIYLGNMVQGKYGSASYKTKQNRPRPRSEWFVVEGTHEPIISRELWQQVQKRQERQTRTGPAGKAGLFSGTARCSVCGCLLRSTKSRGRRYLQCPTRRVNPEACCGAFISEQLLEQAVLKELQGLFHTLLNPEELQQALLARCSKLDSFSRLREALEQCERTAAQYDTSLRELYRNLGRGLVSHEEGERLSAVFSTERAQLEQRAQELRSRLTRMQTTQVVTAEELCPQRLDRQLVLRLLESVYVGHRTSGSQEVSVELQWRF